MVLDRSVLRPQQIGEWTVVPAEGRIVHPDRPDQRLRPQLIDILVTLARRPGEVWLKDELISEVWGTEFVSDSVLSSSIAELRQALGDSAREPRYIETIPKRGYRLISRVSPIDAADADVAAAADPAGSHAAGPALSRPLIATAAAALVMVIAATVVWMTGRQSPAPEETPLDVPLQTASGDLAPFAISPDGRSILYARRGDAGGLVIHALEDGTSRQIDARAGASVPFFTSDGREAGAIADATLRLVPVSGGEGRAVLELPDSFGVTSTDSGTVVFSPGVAQPLHRALRDGSQRRPLTTLDAGRGETSHRWPHAIAGTEAVLFTSGGPNSGTSVHVADTVTGASRLLIDNAFSAMYSGTGHIVFARETTLMAAPFDARRLELTGDPVQIVAGVAVRPQNMRALYSVALDGTLVYVPEQASLPPLRMVWVSRGGDVTPVDAPARAYRHPRLSPDGSRVAMWIEEQASREIWTYEFATKRLTRVTFERDRTRPVWSADGRSIVYDGSSVIVRRMLDPIGAADPVTHHKGQLETLVPDGSGVILSRNDPVSGLDLWLASTTGRQVPLVTDAGNQGGATLSPGAKWLAYTSSPGPRVVVRRFNAPGAPVDVGPGDEPAWSSDGRVLMFRRGDAMFEAAITTTSDGIRVAAPSRLFEGTFDRRPATRANYDVTNDGSRFLMLQVDPAQPRQPPLVKLTGWHSRIH